MPGGPEDPFDPFAVFDDDPPLAEDLVEAPDPTDPTDAAIEAWRQNLQDRREPVEVFVAPAQSGPGSKRARAGIAAPKRSYPLMMALVEGLEERPKPEPIPRTFVPNRAPPKRRASTARPEVEDM